MTESLSLKQRQIKLYEWLAGYLLVRASKLHAKLGGRMHNHERLHIYTGVLAMNTSKCAANCCLNQSYLSPRDVDVFFRADLGLINKVPK